MSKRSDRPLSERVSRAREESRPVPRRVGDNCWDDALVVRVSHQLGTPVPACGRVALLHRLTRVGESLPRGWQYGQPGFVYMTVVIAGRSRERPGAGG